MTAFPIFYAVIENDLRRVLAYSLNNQLGFMVVGIGIGTELALNGTAAHAFAHILYKALLFMSMGAVLLPRRHDQGLASWAACTSRCPGRRGSASSAPPRSRRFRCSAASSASR